MQVTSRETPLTSSAGQPTDLPPQTSEAEIPPYSPFPSILKTPSNPRDFSSRNPPRKVRFDADVHFDDHTQSELIDKSGEPPSQSSRRMSGRQIDLEQAKTYRTATEAALAKQHETLRNAMSSGQWSIEVAQDQLAEAKDALRQLRQELQAAKASCTTDDPDPVKSLDARAQLRSLKIEIAETQARINELRYAIETYAALEARDDHNTRHNRGLSAPANLLNLLEEHIGLKRTEIPERTRVPEDWKDWFAEKLKKAADERAAQHAIGQSAAPEPSGNEASRPPHREADSRGAESHAPTGTPMDRRQEIPPQPTGPQAAELGPYQDLIGKAQAIDLEDILDNGCLERDVNQMFSPGFTAIPKSLRQAVADAVKARLAAAGPSAR